MPKPPLRIVNIIATARFAHNLDLTALSTTIPALRYKPKKFGGAILRLPNRTTALLWTNGKVVIVGAKTESASRAGFSLAAQACGFSDAIADYKIHNVVGTVNLGFRLNLSTFYRANGTSVVWEPELFPALTYRFKGAVINLFTSGNIVITGLRSVDAIVSIYDILYVKLLKNKY